MCVATKQNCTGIHKLTWEAFILYVTAEETCREVHKLTRKAFIVCLTAKKHCRGIHKLTREAFIMCLTALSMTSRWAAFLAEPERQVSKAACRWRCMIMCKALLSRSLCLTLASVQSRHAMKAPTTAEASLKHFTLSPLQAADLEG